MHFATVVATCVLGIHNIILLGINNICTCSYIYIHTEKFYILLAKQVNEDLFKQLI